MPEEQRLKNDEVKEILIVYNGTPLVERRIAVSGRTFAQYIVDVQALPSIDALFVKVIYTRTYAGGVGSVDGAGDYYFSDKIFGYDYYWFNLDGSWGGGLSTDAPDTALKTIAGIQIPNLEWYEISNLYCKEVKVV